MEPTLIVQLISQRVSEINVWIGVRNAVWTALLITALWLCGQGINKSDVKTWVLVCFTCIGWLGFETSAGYYIGMNGAESLRLENLLPRPDVAHEHQRVIEKQGWAPIVAPFGFFIAYALMFGFACARLISEHRAEGGLGWVVLLAAGLAFTVACFYFVMKSVKP
jgi:hypothetical protein